MWHLVDDLGGGANTALELDVATTELNVATTLSMEHTELAQASKTYWEVHNKLVAADVEAAAEEEATAARKAARVEARRRAREVVAAAHQELAKSTAATATPLTTAPLATATIAATAVAATPHATTAASRATTAEPAAFIAASRATTAVASDSTPDGGGICRVAFRNWSRCVCSCSCSRWWVECGRSRLFFRFVLWRVVLELVERSGVDFAFSIQQHLK